MRLALLLLFLSVACAGQECYKRPAGDGCNTETVCGDFVTTTLAYCGSSEPFNPFPKIILITPRPLPQDLMPLPEPEGPILSPTFVGSIGPPETPMDVPAIQEGYQRCTGGIAAGQSYTCTNYEPDTRWTCADKSRVLLTAEDGSKHCVKF